MILVRHGQSEFNVIFGATRKDPGIIDPKLTDEGRRQAESAGHDLTGKGLKRIIVSPYTRTLQTADIIAGILNLPITIDSLIREHAFFSCDIGTPRSVLSQDWPHLDFAALSESWWPSDPETEDDVRARCRSFHKRMAGTHDWPEVLVVSHWGFIRGLTGHEAKNGEVLSFDPTAAS
ncbi:histidine phosphatase family protein [Denitrobaculum tricleocarpae]|uniref:Histidine phosphatase family protein n=1 Tax=Denitrobaculum tricleocarpae TaxID=2591009 RepID=A0A545TRT1_9PROT|nr:histidine phosphatase family protein [Denitrobaculum tricleocarpae]TQV79841.1 histidine phosphatase family protein [Denitrobaculum tricleocarpae]